MTDATRKALQAGMLASEAEFRRRYRTPMDDMDYTQAHDVVADMSRTAHRNDILHNSFFASGSQLDRRQAYG